MKKDITLLIICEILTLLMGCVGIRTVSENKTIYPIMEVADLSPKVEEYEIKKEEFEKNAFSESINYVGNYEIKINTKEKGYPSEGSLFTTYCMIKDENAIVNIDYYFYTKNPEKDVINYSELKTIKIAQKEYKYLVNPKSNKIILYYKNDERSYLKIFIKGDKKFNEDGTLAGIVNVSEKILKSDYIKDEIKFKIKKLGK